MAFLRNSLNLAEKFLDGLDKKADASGVVAPPPSSDKPFTRRSTSTSSFGGGSDSFLSPATPGRLHASASQSFDRDSDVASQAIAPGSPGRRAHDAASDVAATSGKLDAAAAQSSTDDARDAPTLPTRARRNSQSRDADADTAAALLHAVQEKDARILQLTLQNEELRRAQRDFEADLNDLEAELRAAVAERDRAKKQESSLEQQIKDAYAESAAARARVEALQEDLARCDPKFYGKLEAQVEGLQTELDALRDQLLRAEQSRSQAQEQLTAFRAAAQRREDELMTENKELTKALASAEVASSIPNQASVSQFAVVEAELEAAIRRDAVAAAEAAMLAERRLSSERLRQMEQQAQQLAVAHESLDKAKAELVALRVERDSTVSKLRAELATAAASLKENRTAQLETRLTTLADSLLEKQGVVDQLISEKSSLNQRLELERQRRRVAEDTITALQSKTVSSNQDMEADLEEGFTPSAHRKPRRGWNATPITRIEALNKNPTVAQAADTVDQFCLRSARFLGVNPYARLLFFVYLVLLHLWALFILSFHTHQLEASAGGGGPIISPTGQILAADT